MAISCADGSVPDGSGGLTITLRFCPFSSASSLRIRLISGRPSFPKINGDAIFNAR